MPATCRDCKCRLKTRDRPENCTFCRLKLWDRPDPVTTETRPASPCICTAERHHGLCRECLLKRACEVCGTRDPALSCNSLDNSYCSGAPCSIKVCNTNCLRLHMETEHLQCQACHQQQQLFSPRQNCDTCGTWCCPECGLDDPCCAGGKLQDLEDDDEEDEKKASEVVLSIESMATVVRDTFIPRHMQQSMCRAWPLGNLDELTALGLLNQTCGRRVLRAELPLREWNCRVQGNLNETKTRQAFVSLLGDLARQIMYFRQGFRVLTEMQTAMCRLEALACRFRDLQDGKHVAHQVDCDRAADKMKQCPTCDHHFCVQCYGPRCLDCDPFYLAMDGFIVDPTKLTELEMQQLLQMRNLWGRPDTASSYWCLQCGQALVLGRDRVCEPCLDDLMYPDLDFLADDNAATAADPTTGALPCILADETPTPA